MEIRRDLNMFEPMSLETLAIKIQEKDKLVSYSYTGYDYVSFVSPYFSV